MLFLAFDKTLLFRQQTYAPSNPKMLATAKNPASIAILATNKSTRRKILWVHAQCGSLDLMGSRESSKRSPVAVVDELHQNEYHAVYIQTNVILYMCILHDIRSL